MTDLSIIIPIYIKPLDRIKRSINSALDQKCSLELILVYQWFSEESYEYIKSLESDIIKVFYYDYPLSHHIARVSHIKDCNGEYIAFLDCDDYVDQYYYDDCIKDLKKNNADATSGNIKTSDIDNKQLFITEYKKISKENFMFESYWLRGIFLTEKIKKTIPLFEKYNYYLTHHDDFFEKIILFHYCSNPIIIKINTYYNFILKSVELENYFIFKNVYSIIIIYHLLKDFIIENYSYFNKMFIKYIYEVMDIDKTLRNTYFNDLFRTFTFDTIPKIVINNNFNAKYYKVNIYDDIICLSTNGANKVYKDLFLQFYYLYQYGGFSCTEDYFFNNNIEEIRERSLAIFKSKDGLINIDIVAACIKNEKIWQCFQYLVNEKNNTESLDYYRKNLTEIVKDDMLDNFDNYFKSVNLI
jgi:hypothetical protein